MRRSSLFSALAALLAAALLAGGVLGAPVLPDQPGQAAPAAPRYFHPTFRHNYSGYQSALYVQNLGAAPAAVVLDFYGPEGGSPIEQHTTIPTGATFVYGRGQEIPGLGHNDYSLVISADQLLASVVEVYATDGDRLAAYSGTPQTGAAQQLVFSPFFDTGGLDLLNTSASQPASVSIDFYNGSGTHVHHLAASLAARGHYQLPSASAQLLPGAYTAIVSADQDLVGLLTVHTAGPEPVFELLPPAPPAAPSTGFARALRQVDEGAGARTTQLYLTNRGQSDGHLTVTFTKSDGQVAASQAQAVPVDGTALVDLAALPQVAVGAYGVTVSSDTPLALNALSTYAAPAAIRYSSALYGDRIAAAMQGLARLAWTDEAYTVFSVYNPNTQAALAHVEYRNLSGTAVAGQDLPVPAGGWQRIDLHQVKGLVSGFRGSAMVTADRPLAVLVDDFYGSCTPPGQPVISRAPSGPVYAGIEVHFSAAASGSLPLRYSWLVDGQASDEDDAALSHTFMAAGRHNLAVNVSNACGRATSGLDLDVLALPSADLSSSLMTAGQGAVAAGEVLTYTLLVRNSGLSPTAAALTAPVPLQAAYLPGSASASDESGFALSGGALSWHSTIAASSVVLLHYAVVIDKNVSPIGAVITAQASLSDAQGNVTPLQTQSVYNPGYRMTINDGAIFTADPTVTLQFAWNPADHIKEYQVSNDSSFGVGVGTSAWLPANPDDPTYPGWALAPAGDQRAPRRVYMRFRSTNGAVCGSLQDDILLDGTPPAVDDVNIDTTLAQMGSGVGRPVNIRITARDDNSGVWTIQLSNSPDFASWVSYPVSQGTSLLPWRLQPSGRVYVAAVDRAGNRSPVVAARGSAWYPAYLPLAVQGGKR